LNVGCVVSHLAICLVGRIGYPTSVEAVNKTALQFCVIPIFGVVFDILSQMGILDL
jgi:hypothetical protein